jgi:hypothetical protein
MSTSTLVEQPVQAGRLEQVWGGPTGLAALTAVNHKTIGLRFIVTALVFFVLAGITALVMRVQLAQPGMNVLSPEAYNQFFTSHGTSMMFLFAVPIMEGFGMYFVPLMIGTRDMAFPRLNAFGYWVFLLAGVTLYVAFALGLAPNAGWFNYAPLSSKQFSPGINIDLWATAITFLEIAALVAAVEIIVTIFRQRAPGMTMSKMPLFVWSQLVMSFMIVFAMPPLMLASVFLALDRMVGTHILQRDWRRATVALAAPVLVVRASGGLHHLRAGARHGVFDHPDLCPAVADRLPAGRVVDRSNWHRELRPVGASHVYRGPADPRDELLRGCEHDDCHPQRRSDLRVDRHALGRASQVERAAAVDRRLPPAVRHRGAHGRDGCGGAL